jgi:hypothetical protein
MKTVTISMIFTIIVCIVQSCNGSKKEQPSTLIEKITDLQLQEQLFSKLIELTNRDASKKVGGDSLAFLILPVDAACPSCRNKTVDSISKYKLTLSKNRFVIVSGTSPKIIRVAFEERQSNTPVDIPNIFIDSINKSFLNDLAFTRPMIYYSSNHRVYLKISCVPKNIKQELHRFFSNKMDSISIRNEPISMVE